MARSDSISRSAAFTALALTLGALTLGACSADLSLNRLPLAPKPETMARNSDASGQAWARGTFERPISATNSSAEMASAALIPAISRAPDQQPRNRGRQRRQRWAQSRCG